MKRVKPQEIQAVTETKTEVPDFIKEFRAARKEILTVISELDGEDREEVVKRSSVAMRTAQIINAFVKKRKLASVECGRIDNIRFNRCLDDAFAFMAIYAENKYNKMFRQWVEENLIEMGYGHKIIKVKNSNFIV